MRFEEALEFDDKTIKGSRGFGSTDTERSSREARTKQVNRYIPEYVNTDLKWFERDGLLTYIDQLKYRKYSSNSNNYVANANIINFDIIHSMCRGDDRKHSDNYFKTVEYSQLKNMPEKDKDIAVSSCLSTKRKDVFVDKKLAFDHFRKLSQC